MRFFLPPVRRPRHPLARVLMAVLGLAVLGVFMVFGLVALAVFLAVGSVLFLLRMWATRGQRNAPESAGKAQHTGEIIEGEFVVVHERHHAHHH